MLSWTEFALSYDVDWSKFGELGTGKTARVHRGRCLRTNELVAVKLVDLACESSPKDEIAALAAVSGHPNIVRLLGSFRDDGHVAIVMEYLNGGDLFDRIVHGGVYQERDVREHARALASALAHMHARGFVHRDVKPENLVLTERRPNSPMKFVDFGLTCPEDWANGAVGTEAYAAPEMGFGSTTNRRYTTKVDVWSLGIVLYEMFCTYHPFDPDGTGDDRLLLERVRLDQWNFDRPAWERVSDSAKDSLKRMIQHDPSQRPTMREVLGHPWFSIS